MYRIGINAILNNIDFDVIVKTLIVRCFSENRMQETTQLTITLFLVYTAFLILANPIQFLLVIYSYVVDNRATPYRFAVFQLLKTIFEMVNNSLW